MTGTGSAWSTCFQGSIRAGEATSGRLRFLSLPPLRVGRGLTGRWSVSWPDGDAARCGPSTRARFVALPEGLVRPAGMKRAGASLRAPGAEFSLSYESVPEIGSGELSLRLGWVRTTAGLTLAFLTPVPFSSTGASSTKESTRPSWSTTQGCFPSYSTTKKKVQYKRNRAQQGKNPYRGGQPRNHSMRQSATAAHFSVVCGRGCRGTFWVCAQRELPIGPVSGRLSSCPSNLLSGESSCRGPTQ